MKGAVTAVRLSGRSAGARATEYARNLPAATPLIKSFEREQRSGSALLAGGLAYRFFFWLVALGLVVAAAASFWVRESEASLEDAAESFGLSGVAAHSAASAVHSGSHARWYLLATGLVLLIYFGVGAVRALRVAAIIAWQLDPSRLRKPIRASAVFTGFFVAAVTMTMVASWTRSNVVGLGLLVTIAAVVVFVALAVLAFQLLPKPDDVAWPFLLPGAVLVGCGITAIHVFTVYYLAGKLERSPKLYGTLGAATVVLVGLFLIARVIVSAMFLNATLARLGSPSRGDEAAPTTADAFERVRGTLKRNAHG